jgi:hypothetical protein
MFYAYMLYRTYSYIQEKSVCVGGYVCVCVCVWSEWCINVRGGFCNFRLSLSRQLHRTKEVIKKMCEIAD